MTVLEIPSGKVIATVPIGAGVDAVSYDAVNRSDHLFQWRRNCNHHSPGQSKSVFRCTNTQTQWKAKTHAYDPQTKTIYFCAFDMQSDNKTRIPDSFKVLVYKMKS